jgi:hypothetical protein
VSQTRRGHEKFPKPIAPQVQAQDPRAPHAPPFPTLPARRTNATAPYSAAPDSRKRWFGSPMSYEEVMVTANSGFGFAYRTNRASAAGAGLTGAPCARSFYATGQRTNATVPCLAALPQSRRDAPWPREVFKMPRAMTSRSILANQSSIWLEHGCEPEESGWGSGGVAPWRRLRGGA